MYHHASNGKNISNNFHVLEFGFTDMFAPTNKRAKSRATIPDSPQLLLHRNKDIPRRLKGKVAIKAAGVKVNYVSTAGAVCNF